MEESTKDYSFYFFDGIDTPGGLPDGKRDNNGEIIKKRGGKCRICINTFIVCERGFQNFMAHLNSAHSGKNGSGDYKQIFIEQKPKEYRTIKPLDSYVDNKSSIYFKWLDWIINQNLPFNFCEDSYSNKIYGEIP
jgi:hypothetical protein